MNPVLVVEDNAEIREVLEEMMRANGVVVESAGDGAQGWERVRREPHPCLILLDLKMPVMDGIEFLKRRNSDPEAARIPVIMLTGSAELEGRQEELNFQGFVKKPFDPDALFQVVRQHCD